LLGPVQTCACIRLNTADAYKRLFIFYCPIQFGDINFY